MNNLGFHLYRSMDSVGPYERVTLHPIPGLGSSPAGASYHYRDTGLTNGIAYYYTLEDIETTGKTEMHGPVSATPRAGASSNGGESSGRVDEDKTSLIAYGDPSASSLRVVNQGRSGVTLELVTGGFYADPQDDGSARLEIPGFEALTKANAPGIPVKRTRVEALAGRQVKLVSVTAQGVEAFSSLQPSDAETSEIVATRDGTVLLRQGYGGQVRATRRRSPRRLSQRPHAAFQGEELYPAEAARVVSVGFQGDVKKALVELAPLRWDETAGRLFLARRLFVRLSFRERDLSERSKGGLRGRRFRRRRSHEVRPGLVARLATTEKGLHTVDYEEVFGRRRRRDVPTSRLRLSRQGQAVAFHIEPTGTVFGPGSKLYFLSEGAGANPYGREAVYELQVGVPGKVMEVHSAAPSGEATPFYWHRLEQEENRLFQAGLVDAPDRWVWDLVFAPAAKTYLFEINAPAPVAEASRLEVWLQGASDFPANPDHHVSVYVNGSLVEELSWDGKQARKIEAELTPGLLQEGENRLEIENVGDTEASYSMVMLDRFAVQYPRSMLAEQGKLEGTWSESGVSEVSGLSFGAHVLDVTESSPRWLHGIEVAAEDTARFRVEAGRDYLAASPEVVQRPEVTRAKASGLKNERNQADYLLIGPREFLGAAQPLVALRRSQNLQVRMVPIEQIYSEFGFGESTPKAIQDFLSYAYLYWGTPSPRYVLLLGDGTYDFKDYLGTGVVNHVPPLMIKTSYLWTASDAAYGSVNGEDLLPDIALGRLPAASVDELQRMVEKIVSYESGTASLGAPAVLVADNPDGAGNFEVDAEELVSNVLASKNLEKIYLGRIGTAATREAILTAFDEGASIMSYMGHGGIHLWADENILNTSQVGSLTPQAQQPLLITMNCLNGYFHLPYFNSLSEELVKAEGKGAIAAFSPSGLSLNEPAHRFHKALLKELFNGGHERLGDAVMAAQVAYAETGAFPELVSIYLLLGDPALRLR
jgi:hypothetical protein